VPDPVGIALGLAPLAEEAIRAAVGKNSVAKLVRLVESDLRREHLVPHDQRAAVAAAWSRQRVDPELTGCLLAWLATGQQEFLAGVASRWSELLANEIDQTGVDIDELVAITIASVRGHLARAQRSDRDAIHVEADFTRDVVKDASEDVKQHITRLTRDAGRGRAVALEKRRQRFNLPLVAASFVGRARELEELDEALAGTDSAVITQAISGLGGVGKSQLAARYVQQRADGYDIVAWIRAQDGGIADLAALAAKLGLPVEALSPSDRAQLALDWLGDSRQRWLLVLDNIESAEQLEGLVPRTGSGHVLVTSRDRALRQFGPVLTVEVFDEDTATTYLTERAGKPGDQAAARELARALGCLPLALSHAAAYCQSGTSFADYLELLGELPARELFDSHPELSYQQTVASTWKTSIKAANQSAPHAAYVLEMAAYLGPDAIPTSLFGAVPPSIIKSFRKRDLARVRKHFADALNALARFNLATVDDSTVSVHRLLQKTVREDAAARSNQTTAAIATVFAVNAAFPPDTELPTEWPLCEQLLPHALALADTLTQPDARLGEQFVALLNRVCDYLNHAEPGQRGLVIAQRTLAHAERILGPAHPATLTSRAQVAAAQFWAGHHDQAIASFEPLLTDFKRIVGTEHPATLTTRSHLAAGYYKVGRIDEALALYEQLLADRERIDGAEHPNTLGARGNLAIAYREAGRTDEAIAVWKPLLADFQRILGAEHPNTLTTRNNLTEAYQHAGRTNDAKRIQSKPRS
jgi:tetratricopeptide (TPR) repeat protein